MAFDGWGVWIQPIAIAFRNGPAVAPHHRTPSAATSSVLHPVTCAMTNLHAYFRTSGIGCAQLRRFQYNQKRASDWGRDQFLNLRVYVPTRMRVHYLPVCTTYTLGPRLPALHRRIMQPPLPVRMRHIHISTASRHIQRRQVRPTERAVRRPVRRRPVRL